MLQNLPNRPPVSSLQNVQKISKPTQLETNMYTMLVEAPLSSDSDDQKSTLTPKIQCHQYDVDFEPNIEENNRPLRYKIFKAARKNIENIIGKFSFSGKSLYAMKKFTDKKMKEVNHVDAVSVEGIKYSIRIRWVKQIEINEDAAQNKDKSGTANYKKGNQVTQVLNIILKDIIRDLKFQEIGRNSKFFDIASKAEVKITDRQGKDQGTLIAYNGFTFGTTPTQEKLYLMVDYASRILRKETALQYLKSLHEDEWVEIEGQSVITEYNNYTTYKIERIDRNKNPLSTFTNGKTNEKITFKDYYQQRYGLKITDLKQPLLVNLRKVREANTNVQKIEEVFLIPELCKMTGMTDEQRNNFQAMKDISRYTKLEPLQRLENSIKNCRLLAGVAKQSGITIDHTKNKINAIILNPPKVSFGANKYLHPEKGNFDMRAPTFEQVAFKDWTIIYNQRDEKDMDAFLDTLKKASQAYNINVSDPFFFTVKSNKANDWIKMLDDDFSKNDLPQFVVTFGGNQSHFYQDMKKFLAKEAGIESQHVTAKALQKNGMSVASKIALQIASKLGKKIWKVEVPAGIHPYTMVIGIETSMKKVKKSQVVGVVASVDRDFTKYYSEVDIRQDNATALPTLSNIIQKALASYAKNTKNLPEEIIIYRQGLGEGQIQQSLQMEINAVQNGISLYKKDYNPRFAFFQVNRKIGQKFYAKGGKEGITNPTSGTIVASEVVQNNFEFFMCAQNCNSGVCTPTKYTCLYNNTKLSEESFWQLTYFQTFNYYNWQGPVRVPAAMKYAEKLAKFTSDVLQEKASSELESSLYYL